MEISRAVTGRYKLSVEKERSAWITQILIKLSLGKSEKFSKIFGAKPYLGVKFKYTKWYFLEPKNIERTKNNNYKVEKDYVIENGLELDEITQIDKQVKFDL